MWAKVVAGLSRATAGPGETFSWSSSGKKIFEFFFLKWCILVYFIFLSDDGAPKCRGARNSLPLLPLPLSTFLGSCALCYSCLDFQCPVLAGNYLGMADGPRPHGGLNLRGGIGCSARHWNLKSGIIYNLITVVLQTRRDWQAESVQSRRARPQEHVRETKTQFRSARDVVLPAAAAVKRLVFIPFVSYYRLYHEKLHHWFKQKFCCLGLCHACIKISLDF